MDLYLYLDSRKSCGPRVVLKGYGSRTVCYTAYNCQGHGPCRSVVYRPVKSLRYYDHLHTTRCAILTEVALTSLISQLQQASNRSKEHSRPDHLPAQGSPLITQPYIPCMYSARYRI